ncbi:hypothetical protein [Neptunicella marina]|uniref:Calcineurin-like phosphoesterase domain-containing protein n=1 Tax=Neptunicella marina TaxID=2125989 RepID=A0A8J6IT19_9ALTE|nr:hypothetical protein [Neptunicella marina]MBC3765347.1 hypothetical protein [Neptunicella marina]
MAWWHSISEKLGMKKTKALELPGVRLAEAERGNRMCVSVSDIHLTDGTVGFQNLGEHAWQRFYQTLLQRCKSYYVEELVLLLDGDIVDLIRSSRWAEHGIYPWQREQRDEFSAVVTQIIHDIVEVQHKSFFRMLTSLEDKLKAEEGCSITKVELVITLGNHDKELLCVPDALAYFYEKGLNQPLKDISAQTRRTLGQMYGDETLFQSLESAPYFAFYYADCGFRLFSTHGQWRDPHNSLAVKSTYDLPGWKASDGWKLANWQQQKFAPFLEPCFGDTVAAGLLSTFIYRVKKAFAEQQCNEPRLSRIIDELDLYRPTYAALSRILQETSKMKKQNRGREAIVIIEKNLFNGIREWLSWPFVYESATPVIKLALKVGKSILLYLHKLDKGIEIPVLQRWLKLLAKIERFSNKGEKLSTMKTFPAYLPCYQHYGFQLHIEGHTHVPLQEQPALNNPQPATYINLGTWRDQIVMRKHSGYRRQGVLRALYILDLKNHTHTKEQRPRSFDYFVEDVVNWGDNKDALDNTGQLQAKF